MIITEKDINEMKKRMAFAIYHWRMNPVSFVCDCLGEEILPYQAECMNSVRDNKRTIVKSGHGVGKSHIMARIGAWWLITQQTDRAGECIVTCTAPTASQLEDVLWSRLSSTFARFPTFLKDKFELTTETFYCKENHIGWKMFAKTAKKENAEALQGKHNCLYLIDEWSGVSKEIFNVVQGAMSDEKSKIFAIGNPLKNKGWGYDAFNKDRKLWSNITINCEDWPSTKSFTTEYKSYRQNTCESKTEGRCDPKEFETWSTMYGRDSNEYGFRVLGEFPESESSQLIKGKWVTSSYERIPYHEEGNSYKRVVGIDIARQGDDDSALIDRTGRNINEAITWHSNDLIQSAGYIISYLKEDCAGQDIDYVMIDAIGIGMGVYDMVRQANIPNIKILVPFMASESSPSTAQERMRDYCWWKMRDFFRDKKPSMGNLDDELKERLKLELTTLGYSYTITGKVKIQAKDQLKKAGYNSPDLADALSMTFMYPLDKGIETELTKKQKKFYRSPNPPNWRAV